MTTIGQIYNFIRFVTNHNGKGLVTPDEVSEALEVGQLSLFNQYRANNALDNFTQSALSPFVTIYDFTSSAAGHFTKPATFAQTLIVEASGLEYTPILFNELRLAVQSQLQPISDYPRYQEAGNYIALYPQKAVSGTLTYYRNPVAPVIGSTLDGNGDYVYASGSSTQLEFPQSLWGDIAIKALAYIGVNLNSGEVVALSQQLDNKG